MIKVRPNDQCPCGAAKKYKKCCYKGKPSWQPGERMQQRLRQYGTASRVFSTRFHKMHHHLLPKTEVRPSTIHGNGVFAVEDIPIFTPVAIYPIDYCCFRTKGEEIRLQTRNDVPPYNDNAKVLDQYRMNFQLNTENTKLDDMEICYVADPSKRDYGHAHLINDAGCMNRQSVESWNDYMLSFKKSNVIEYHLGSFGMFFVAIRDIKAGEELLYHYGMSYWAKGADAKLAAERPDMLEAESVLKDTWRQQVAEKLTQLTQLDKNYRQHDFQKVYDQCSAIG
jgi:hypothetical protein